MPENAGRVKFLSFKIKLYNYCLLGDPFYNIQEFVDSYWYHIWFGGDDWVLFDIT